MSGRRARLARRRAQRERVLAAMRAGEPARELGTAARPIEPGDRVVLARPLAGVELEPRGAPRRRAAWTVVACGCELCQLGRHVAVDEPSVYAEGPRHVARAALLGPHSEAPNHAKDAWTHYVECRGGMALGQAFETHPRNAAVGLAFVREMVFAALGVDDLEQQRLEDFTRRLDEVAL